MSNFDDDDADIEDDDDIFVVQAGAKSASEGVEWRGTCFSQDLDSQVICKMYLSQIAKFICLDLVSHATLACSTMM